MDKLLNFINIIDKPVVIWRNNNKEFYCDEYNDEFDNIFNIDEIDEKKLKNIYKFHTKKILKHYNKCLQRKSNQEYDVYHNGSKYHNTIIYIDEEHLLEIIEIINIDNNKLLDDPFNMVLIVKNKSIINNANFLFLRNTKYNKKDIINKSINNVFVNTIDFSKHNQIFNNNIILSDSKLLSVDIYLIKLNGIYDIIIIKDISLIKNNNIYDNIFKNMKDSTIIFEKKNEYFESYECIDINKSCQNIFVNNNNIVKNNIVEIFNESIYFKLKKNYKNILINNNFIIEKIEFNKKYYNFNCFIIDDNTFGIIINDITDIIKNRNNQNNILAEMIDKLRIPLQNINNNITLLSESELTIKQYDYINRILDYNYVLSLMMTDFMDYTNLKLKKLKLNYEHFNLREELNEYYENILLKAAEKKIEIIYKIDSNIPPYIISDKYRFKQIIYNILSNALKFTQNGKIEIKIYSVNIEKNNYNLHISIKDTGIGIEKKNIKNIFIPFYQINNDSIINKGSGLGLSITKSLCELMDGKIKVNSELNNGSTFEIMLPVKEFTDINEIEEKSLNTFKNINVLIMDENSTNRITISKILLDWHIKSSMTSTSDETLFLIRNNHFDACFIDIDSCNTSGCEIAKNIKRNNSYIQVIAMSSFDNRKYDKNVFDYLIIKPIYKQNLLKLFINIFSDRDMDIKKKSTEDVQIYNNISILLCNNIEKKFINTLNVLGYTNVEYIDEKSINDIKNYSLLLINLNNINNTTNNIITNNIINNSNINKKCYTLIKKLKKEKHKPYIIAIKNNNRKKYSKYIDAFISSTVDTDELKALLKVISRKIH